MGPFISYQSPTEELGPVSLVPGWFSMDLLGTVGASESSNHMPTPQFCSDAHINIESFDNNHRMMSLPNLMSVGECFRLKMMD